MPVPRAPQRELHSRRKTIIGKKFGKVTAIRIATDEEVLDHYSKHPSKHWSPLFLCQCDCGKSKIIRAVNLRRGHANSCGCRQIGNQLRLPAGEAMLREIMGIYRRRAVDQNMTFTLVRDEFLEIAKQNCHYCGTEPRERKFRGHTSGLVMNGIDRSDNSKGYEKENCVPCCKICNMAKSDLSLEDFRAWALKLAVHISKENI